MPRISIKNNEKLLIEKYKDKKYYCPHCRILFKKNAKDYKLQSPEKNYPYSCPSCNKYFNRRTYQEKSKNGKHYNLGKGKDIIKKEIRQHISDDIIELWQEGYTIKDIHIITHYSKTLIEEMTQDFKKEHIQVYTLEQFKDILKSEIQGSKYTLIPPSDKRTHKIRKALDIGCSVSQIASILKKSHSTISSARKKPYIAISMKATKTNSKEKMLQIERFLQKAMPVQTRNQKQSQRRTIKISEDGKIIISGMTSKQREEFEKREI